MNIEIMDTTLRDGEQTNGVSFVPHEKLMMARMLLQKVNVDRIEVASARVSDGEREAVTMICRWARQLLITYIFPEKIKAAGGVFRLRWVGEIWEVIYSTTPSLKIEMSLKS